MEENGEVSWKNKNNYARNNSGSSQNSTAMFHYCLFIFYKDT